LAEAGVIDQISTGTYGRQYAATELFDLVSRYGEQVVDRSRTGC
jgi:hypothetical protein